jgi:membrane dipeptidase
MAHDDGDEPGVDLRRDPAAWARRHGISREAAELVATSDVVDLHVDSFIWTRTIGYDLHRRHDRSLTGHRLLGQADVPRLRAAGVTGAVMSVTTNPFRTRAGRRRVARGNLARLRALLDRPADAVAVVADLAAYRRARAAGHLACFLGVQGGHALAAEDLGDPAVADVVRITLVHLTPSVLGAPSVPPFGDRPLTDEGRAVVDAMGEQGILIDLAHAGRRTFWDALTVARPDRPVIVSHTGSRAVHDHWRNVDDDQIRAVADRGGVVGVMLHRGFLIRPGWRARAATVATHLAHVARVGGTACPAIGTDYDGFILPPRDLATVEDLPRLADALLLAGTAPDDVVRILGTNALAAIGAVRPGGDPEASAGPAVTPTG